MLSLACHVQWQILTPCFLLYVYSSRLSACQQQTCCSGYSFTSLGGFGANQHRGGNAVTKTGCGTTATGVRESLFLCFPFPWPYISYFCCPRLPHSFPHVRGAVKPILQWLLQPVSLPCSLENGAGAEASPTARVPLHREQCGCN